MYLRGIPGIVFKLGMQFGVYFAILAEIYFANSNVLLSLRTHATAN